MAPRKVIKEKSDARQASILTQKTIDSLTAALSRRNGPLKVKQEELTDDEELPIKKTKKRSRKRKSSDGESSAKKTKKRSRKRKSIELPPDFVLPRRFCKPTCLEDVQHFMTYNVYISNLVTEACRASGIEYETEKSNYFRPDVLIDSFPPAVLTETLEVCQTDGLITRTRSSRDKAYSTKNQVSLTVLFKRFFNHCYRKDLVELTNQIVSNPSEEDDNPTNSDNPSAMLHMLDLTETDESYDIALGNLARVIDVDIPKAFDKDGKEVKRAVKNSRLLENAPMRLENITITFPDSTQSLLDVPTREDVAQSIWPIYMNKTFKSPALLQDELSSCIEKHSTLNGRVSLKEVLYILDVIEETGFNGITFDELKASAGMNESDLILLLDVFASLSVVFCCGVDLKRCVSVKHSQSWLIKTNTSRFSVRPWTLPSGSINWSILRWMSEPMLMTLLLKPCIKVDELSRSFGLILAPICVQEIMEFFAMIGCCSLREETFVNTKLMSPFESDAQVTETFTYVEPSLDALKKFAVFFMDVPVPAYFSQQREKA